MKTRDQETTVSSPALGVAARTAACRPRAQDTHPREEPVDVPSPRALATVAIDHATISLHVVDLGLDAVYVTLGRDACTGMIVAVALDAARRSPVDVLRLFGNASDPATGGLGAAWTCPGRPEVVVVDHAVEYRAATFHEAARALGIQVVHRPARSSSGYADLGAMLCRSGALRDARASGVVTMAVLVGAVHAWIAASYARPRAGYVGTPRPALAAATAQVPSRPPVDATPTTRAHAWALRGKVGARHRVRCASGGLS